MKAHARNVSVRVWVHDHEGGEYSLMALLLIELLENEKKEEEGYSWAKDLSVPSTATYELCILVQL